MSDSVTDATARVVIAMIDKGMVLRRSRDSPTTGEYGAEVSELIRTIGAAFAEARASAEGD